MRKNSPKTVKDYNNRSMTDYSKRIAVLVNEYENSVEKHLDEEYRNNTKWSDRLADKIAAFGGSWTFIALFAAFLITWMLWNSINVTSHFDPKPFILLNLILSFIAAFQAPIIMMSQNRHAAKDKHESLIDFAINYKAEEEIDDIQNHLHRIETDIAELKKVVANKSSN